MIDESGILTQILQQIMEINPRTARLEEALINVNGKLTSFEEKHVVSLTSRIADLEKKTIELESFRDEFLKGKEARKKIMNYSLEKLGLNKVIQIFLLWVLFSVVLAFSKISVDKVFNIIPYPEKLAINHGVSNEN